MIHRLAEKAEKAEMAEMAEMAEKASGPREFKADAMSCTRQTRLVDQSLDDRGNSVRQGTTHHGRIMRAGADLPKCNIHCSDKSIVVASLCHESR